MSASESGETIPGRAADDGELGSQPALDADAPEAAPLDADALEAASPDAAPLDAAPPDAAPPDAAPSDADPLDADPEMPARIAARGRRLIRERLRRALAAQAGETPAAGAPAELDDELLDRIADEEAERAGGALLRVSIVEAAAQELGVAPAEALHHPSVADAQELLRASVVRRDETRLRPAAPVVGQPALLLDAVHVFGIETLEPGDRDIELRLADAGVDVRKPSTGATIGRLTWDEVRTIAVHRPRRGLSGRRRSAQLVAGTDRGEVTFELPGLSDDEVADHLEPLIARNCEGFRGLVTD